MSKQTTPVLEGFRAAGYCAVWNERLRATCTLPPGHDGDHVDYYNGRQSVTAVEGHRWRQ